MNYLKLTLQLFAESGDGAGQGAADAAVGADGTSAETKNAEAAEGNRAERFEKLIKGEFKDLYDARMQETIRSRLKNAKQTAERYQAALPLLQGLSARYGIAEGKDGAVDLNALSEAMEKERVRTEARETGKPEEQVQKEIDREKQLRAVQEENKSLRDRIARENADRVYQGWMQQARQLGQTYPNFDLRTELQNPDFLRLLQANIDMKTAYHAIHQEELLRGGMQYAVQKTARQMSNQIIANGARPTENAAGAAAAAITRSDISNLSDHDYEEIKRRVRRGERISFG